LTKVTSLFDLIDHNIVSLDQGFGLDGASVAVSALAIIISAQALTLSEAWRSSGLGSLRPLPLILYIIVMRLLSGLDMVVGVKV
jgi:hypothetical protein